MPSVKLKTGYAHTVASVSGDFTQDLILVTDKNTGIPHFVVMTIQSDSSYKQTDQYDPPTSNVYGQSLFADFGT